MEVKLVITPSEEMVQLVDKVINAFTKPAFQGAFRKAPLEPTVEEVVEAATRQVADATSEHKDSVAPKRRRTKAEIDASEKEKDDTLMDEVVEETVLEEITTGVAPAVEVLRAMSIARKDLMDLPEVLKSFGHASVTALSKDPKAAWEYYQHLLKVKAE